MSPPTILSEKEKVQSEVQLASFLHKF